MFPSVRSLVPHVLVALGLSAAAGAQTAEIGDQPSYAFRDALLQGLGAKSLQDLQGKPVLVEFWGYH